MTCRATRWFESVILFSCSHCLPRKYLPEIGDHMRGHFKKSGVKFELSLLSLFCAWELFNPVSEL